nr:unnamed protein product [Callosobruchus analis]
MHKDQHLVSASMFHGLFVHDFVHHLGNIEPVSIRPKAVIEVEQATISFHPKKRGNVLVIRQSGRQTDHSHVFLSRLDHSNRTGYQGFQHWASFVMQKVNFIDDDQSVIDKVERFSNFVAEFVIRNRTVSELKARLEKIEECYDQFDEVQMQAERLCGSEDELRVQTKDRENFENKALKSLGEPVEFWDTPMIYLVSTKLDDVSRNEWEKIAIVKKIPKIIDLTEFLEHRCQLLEAIQCNKQKVVYKGKPNSVLSHVTQSAECRLCKGVHFIQGCDNFLKMAIHERIKEVKRMHLCINCLRANHFAEQCKSKTNCRTCNKRHNSLLHLEKSSPNMQSDIQPSTQTHINTQLNSQPHLNARSSTDDTTAQILSMAEVADSNLISAHVTNPSKSQNVLLATAVVLIKDSSNNVHKVRALLDGASQSNFITKSLCNLLNIEGSSTNIPVVGVGNTQAKVFTKTLIQIQSVQDKSFQVKLSCLVIEKITQDIPNFYIDPTQINIPQNLSLADQNYYEAGEVQLLLGAGIFYDMLLPGKISLGKNMPVCQNSRLGWFLAGNITMFMDNQVDLNSNPQISCNLTMTQCNKQLHEQIEKFWAIEECSHTVPLTKEEEECEALFKQTTIREEETGKFIVTLPIRENSGELGDSFETAKSQFFRLEKKLQKNKDLKGHYTEFMNELNTVTYGTAPASYLSIRCLNEIAYQKGQEHPEACDAILNNFYVDDFLGGTDTIEKAIELKSNLSLILKEYGFVLRKWVANEPQILSVEDHTVSKNHEIKRGNEAQKTLGLLWQSNHDVLNYTVNNGRVRSVTKRAVLSMISQIFDPLGLIGPTTIQLKILMQQLWQSKLDWDDSLPVDLLNTWAKTYDQLEHLNEITIPRQVISFGAKYIEVHGFSDSTPPKTWKTFVANRVAEIQTLSETCEWRHVPSFDNPADIISRGLEPTELKSCTLWWSGPGFLKQTSEGWPNQFICNTTNNNLERKPICLVNTNVTSEFDIFGRYSSLYKLQRIVALCLRFKRNLTVNRKNRIAGAITGWSNEYLSSLQKRAKWYSSSSCEPKVGDLVVLKDENTAPQFWRLGRIQNLHPGSDGVVRVLSIKTVNGIVTRAIQRVCLLPIEHP